MMLRNLCLLIFYFSNAEAIFLNSIKHHEFRKIFSNTVLKQTVAKREISFSEAERSAQNRNRQLSLGQLPRRIPIGPPKVRVTQNEVRGVIGSNVTFECFIESFPKATNFWRRNEFQRLPDQENPGKYLILEDAFQHLEFGERLRLQIFSVDSSDVGSTFRCISSNEFGTDTGLMRITTPTYLETQAFPDNEVLHLPLKSSLVLQCKVKGYPTATTYWIRKSTGEQLMWNDDYHVLQSKNILDEYTSELEIRSLAKADFTTFLCISKNSFGKSQHAFRITEKTPSWFSNWSSSASLNKAILALHLAAVFLAYIFE